MIGNIIKFRDNPRYWLYYSRYRKFYDSSTKNDTIFAPATSIDPTKGSPLGVIRVSGKKTESVLRRLTRCDITREINSQNVRHRLIKPRIAHLTKIFPPNDQDEPVDLGLVLWFPNPKSYTGEDVCEFHTHGSQAIMKNLLTCLGQIEGLRPAEPGEFTRRAVLNNKMNVIQAESLSSLIAAKTDVQRKLALSGLDGSTRLRYDAWIEDLVKILAHLEASIDFGEDELVGEFHVVRECIWKLQTLSDNIHQFISTRSQSKQFIESGFYTVILGKPNVGKSTIMNLMSRSDRSIVSDLEGTTRDVIKQTIELNGHSITLCDTAGLKQLMKLTPNSCEPSESASDEVLLTKHDAIEQIGIKKAIDEARNADLILYVIDIADLYNDDNVNKTVDEILMALSMLLDSNVQRAKLVYLVVNKIDLNEEYSNDTERLLDKLLISLKIKLEERKIINHYDIESSSISCKTEKNFTDFIDKLTSCLNKFSNPNIGKPELSNPCEYDSVKLEYINERHLSLLRSAHRHLDRACKLDMRTIDEMAQHVREAVDYLSRIVGSVSNDQVIDVIFRDFCIGK